jgi:hypothetical protein
MPLAKIL